MGVTGGMRRRGLERLVRRLEKGCGEPNGEPVRRPGLPCKVVLAFCGRRGKLERTGEMRQTLQGGENALITSEQFECLRI